nr:probable helicase MAGATAMA 3 [Ipomoea batatas]
MPPLTPSYGLQRLSHQPPTTPPPSSPLPQVSSAAVAAASANLIHRCCRPPNTQRFLRGNMYGPFSFINVSKGNEEFNGKSSSKNIAEIFAITEIVAMLYRESLASKQRVRVGCISPYKAQVYAIQEKLGKKYSTDEDSYSVVYSCGSLFDSPVPNGKAAMKPGP